MFVGEKVNLKLLLISMLLVACVSTSSLQDLENYKFCIHSKETVLSKDLELVKSERERSDCEVKATILTLEEKEGFLKTLCADLKDTLNIEQYYYFKLHNGELTGRGVLNDICEGKINPFLAWVSYNVIQHKYLPELNPTEHLSYIAKATNNENKTELCHFQHSDLVSNSTSNLSNCLTFIYQDNFFPLGENLSVLVELQPIAYELHNLTYTPWANVSLSYKTMLGKTTLKNYNTQTKQIYGGLTYPFIEKVKLNLTSVYVNKLEKLPIFIEHRNDSLAVDKHGNTGIQVKDKTYFGRLLAPNSVVRVNVVGQWSDLGKQCSADVYEIFGYGVKRFLKPIQHVSISFTRITSTEPVFEDNRDGKHFARLTEDNELFDIVTDSADVDPNLPAGRVYPNFYIYTIIGCIIVGIALVAAIGSMVRTCDKERELRELEEQKKYELVTSTDIN